MGNPMFSGVGIVDMQNSLGTTTFSRNSYGTYTKIRIGAPAGSSYLTAWQAIYSSLFFDWANILNDGERYIWYNYRIPIKDNMTKRHFITGFDAYFYTNLNLALIAEPPLYTPPSSFNAPPIPEFPFWGSLSAGALNFSMSLQPPYPVAIYTSKLLPATRMSLNQIYAYIEFMSPLFTNQNIWVKWNARFGALTSGMKLFGKAVAINPANGARSAATYWSAIVP